VRDAVESMRRFHVRWVGLGLSVLAVKGALLAVPPTGFAKLLFDGYDRDNRFYREG